MPKARDPAARNKDTPRTLNRAEMLQLMEDRRVPCPGCGGEFPARLLIPYAGEGLCSACFLGAAGRAREEARRGLVPLFLRARRYADMANSWRMKRPCDCEG